MSIEADQHHGYNEHYEQEDSRLNNSNNRPMYVYKYIFYYIVGGCYCFDTIKSPGLINRNV